LGSIFNLQEDAMTIDDELWNSIIEGFNQIDRRLQAILKSTPIKEQDETSVTLEAPSPFHTFQLKQNLDLIKSAIETATGENLDILLAEKPKEFQSPVTYEYRKELSDSEIEIAMENIPEFSKDIEIIYTYQEFDIIDIAISTYITDVKKLLKQRVYFKETNRNSALVEYRLEFLGSGHTITINTLSAFIKIRKIGNGRIEISMKNPFWLKENRKLLLVSSYQLLELHQSRNMPRTDIIDDSIEMTNNIINASKIILEEVRTRLEQDELITQSDVILSNFNHTNLYISKGRINQLQKISNPRFDLQRLIQLCNELNICHQNDCYLAIAMLVRTILDHVPPIFGVSLFSEVANNYSSGAKSFRESMKHLAESARKIGDAHLHTQIRKKEVLPTNKQVDFMADLDVLLGEIVRVL
jgi:hypothetical protein